MSDVKRVETTVGMSVHEQMTRAANRLGISKKQFIADAIHKCLDELSVHQKCSELREENLSLSKEKSELLLLKNDLIKQCDRAVSDHNAAKMEIDELLQREKALQQLVEGYQKDYITLKKRVSLYENRGLFARIFNRDV